VVETGDGGRGWSYSGEDRDGAAQCMARLASLRPSGGPGRVGWPGSEWEAELAGGCSAATTGNRIPASRWYGQGNTRVCKLSGCGKKL
jgi:hypothetical protein